MVSVYRDTYLFNIGNDMYRKARRGFTPTAVLEWAVSMLNTNLDLDIKEFVPWTSMPWQTLVIELSAESRLPWTEEAGYVNGYCR